jgi:hypothetical protein
MHHGIAADSDGLGKPSMQPALECVKGLHYEAMLAKYVQRLAILRVWLDNHLQQ